MYHSKLLLLYQQLTKSERRQFKKWLHSPLHNEHQGVQQLFAFINGCKHWTKASLAKPKAWAVVYPHKPYDDGHWRYIMALGLEVLLEFVGYWQGQQQPVERQRDKAAFLLERQIGELGKETPPKSSTNAQQAPCQCRLPLPAVPIGATKIWSRRHPKPRTFDQYQKHFEPRNAFLFSNHLALRLHCPLASKFAQNNV